MARRPAPDRCRSPEPPKRDGAAARARPPHRRRGHGGERHPAGGGGGAVRARCGSWRRSPAACSWARTRSPTAAWWRPPSRRPSRPSRGSAASWTPTAWCATARWRPARCGRPPTRTPSWTASACARASTWRSSTAPRRTASPTWRCASRLRTIPPSRTGTALLVEVGGGSADISFLRKGQPIHSGTYPLGSIRMRQTLASWQGSHEQGARLLVRHIHNVVDDIRREMPLREARHFIALGGRRALRRRPRSSGTTCPEDEAPVLRAGPVRGVLRRAHRLRRGADRERYRLPPSRRRRRWCPPCWPTASCCWRRGRPGDGARRLAAARACSSTWPPSTTARAIEDLRKQVLASAAALGEKYRYDAAHARKVAELAVRLFDELTAPSTGWTSATGCCWRWRRCSTTSATT